MNTWRKIFSWQIQNDFEAFEKELNREGYSYVIKDGVLIVNNNGNVYLFSLTSLPDNVQFNNDGYVYLSSLTSLPDNVQFNNRGGVYLSSLTSLPDNVQFNNRGDVYLSSLTSLPDNIQFNNKGDVYLDSLTSLPDNIQFNNRGSVDLSSLTSLPDNKYEMFHNGGVVDYNGDIQEFNPQRRETSLKFSWQIQKTPTVHSRVKVIATESELHDIDISELNAKSLVGRAGIVMKLKDDLLWDAGGAVVDKGGYLVLFELSYGFTMSWWFPYLDWDKYLEVVDE